MKPEHRHELKTNELAQWLANLPQWAKENVATIIYVSIVIVAVVGLYAWRGYQKNVVTVNKQLELTRLVSEIANNKPTIIQAQAKGFDTSYNLLTTAENLKALAGKAKDDKMAALALIKAGDAIRTELHYRLGTAGLQESTGQIEKAAACYTDAAAKAEGTAALAAAAKFGLGLCAEELGNFQQAQQIYSNITENPDFNSTIASAAAGVRLKTFAEYQKEITFNVPAKKTPTPQTIQQSIPAATDNNPTAQ